MYVAEDPLVDDVCGLCLCVCMCVRMCLSSVAVVMTPGSGAGVVL